MRKSRYRGLLLVLAAAAVFALGGCGGSPKTDSEEDYMYIWYLNEEENGLVHSSYTGEAASTESEIAEFLKLIQTVPSQSSFKPLLDDSVTILGSSLEGSILTLNFSKGYRKMERTREVLARGGIVRTFVQIPGILGVRFLINGKECVLRSGETLGVMNADNFVEDAGKKVNAVQHVAITLYFTGETGDTLRREARSIYYTASKPLEWAIVERIIAGPKVNGNYATVPANTQIISVTSDNGVCYVNLNETFITNALNTDAEIPIYSIVNSLIDDCRDINEVKISIEGESNMIFKQSMDLSHPFEADYTMVEAPAKTA